VRRVFEETGFAAYVGDNRLDRAAFVEAVGRASTVKPDHYTVLSRPGARERLQAHLADDPFWAAYLA
jgi:hypothetical protein